MCLIVFACHSHPDYPLVVVAHRDEFFARPTRPAHFWSDHPAVFAGRDLEATTLGKNGTWMGINRQGRFAAVTNFREMDLDEHIAPRSRGELPAAFLRSNISITNYLSQVQTEKTAYKGFNLLLWENDKLFYTSNRIEQARELPAGIYGLSNGVLDSPWPKVRYARQQLQTALANNSGGIRVENLVKLLDHRVPAPDHELPDTGIDIESERLLSACFIHSEHYGTRASTVLLIARDGAMTFLEQNWNEKGEAAERRYLSVSAAAIASR